ncbi:DUF2917 domain-containing protein [Undibacterium crateris]|uniref:DUF2917 domain-containing protein n=1 Tax=Undibacterium crateris TaxID=2528175 RepID=UPI001389F3D0|nr:DUF2917 domain-containing protein [Undibacterium crateris]NDI87299.1 DUF2917 domain-containing protein [Undibacterium crateris]
MQKQAEHQLLQLAAGQIESWTGTHTHQVCVHSGLVWLTISEDPLDYWLSEGMQMHLPAKQKVVVESWDAPSTLSLQQLEQMQQPSLQLEQTQPAEVPSAVLNNESCSTTAGELACR